MTEVERVAPEDLAGQDDGQNFERSTPLLGPTDRVAPEELVARAESLRAVAAPASGQGDADAMDRAAQYITRLEGENERLRLAARFAADWFEAPSEDGELVLDQLNAALSNSTKEGT